MPYFISSESGGKYGTFHPHDQVDFSPTVPSLIGVTLKLAVVACAAIEAQIGQIMSGRPIPPGVSTALFLYMGTRAAPGADKTLETTTLVKLSQVLATTRVGLEDEMNSGVVEIHQTDPSFGSSFRGYVPCSRLTGKMGPIHLAYNRIVQDDLFFSGALSANLLFHEATHRYAKTIDGFPDPNDASTPFSGYFNRPPRNATLLAAFKMADGDAKAKRALIAGASANALTPDNALKNADSISFFLHAVLDDAATCLPDVLKDQTRTALTRAVQDFERIQRRIMEANAIVQALGIDSQVSFLRISSGNFFT